jgi:oxidase EvaA
MIVESVSQMDLFLQETVDKSHFSIEKLALSSGTEWQLHDGVLSHKSGGFFHVLGLENDVSKEEKLALYQPQGAYNGLAISRQGEEVYILLQARVEPGNCGVGQYGPSIQSTPANYMRLHGGKATPYFDLFFQCCPSLCRPVQHSTQLDLGSRYFQKSKTLSYIETYDLIATADNMLWVPLSVLKDVLDRDNYLNTDLRSMLGIFDWDGFVNNDPVLHENDTVTSSLPEFERRMSGQWNFKGLGDLRSWQLSKTAISANSGSDLSVYMYEISCFGREVQTWKQPLMCSAGRGEIVLLQRQQAGETEFLLAVNYEFGVSGEALISPSYQLYPEDDMSVLQKIEGNILVSMCLSEEGGRFFQDENRYRLIEVREDFVVEKHQFWVSKRQFRRLLSSSGLLSIQLRVMTSLVLNTMNSQVF